MDSVYHPPPNWPPPPAGWTPPPGWTPDPSWPEPPQSWSFWVPAPNSPQARRKRRLWLTVGLPLAVVGLIVVLGVVVVGGITSLAGNLQDTVTPARAAASSYLSALKEQRYDAAFDMRCAADRGNRATFVQHWKGQKSTGHEVVSFKIVGVNVQTINGNSRAQADLELHFADGYRENQRLPLIRTGSTWQPCS